MTVNPTNYPAMDVALFDYANDWIMHDGTKQPVADDVYLKVMYSNGAISSKVRVAKAWTFWTGNRDWWIKPEPCDRLYIMMYVVI